MPRRCSTEPGVVVNPANGQRLSYGEIAAFGKVPSPLPAVDAKELKAQKDWRLIGKGVPRRDTPLKVNGTADLRHRRAAARHGLRHHAALAGAQLRAGELERRRDQEDAGRDRHRAAAERRRGRRRPLRAGAGGPQRAQGDLAEGQGRRLQLRAGAATRTTCKIHHDPNAPIADRARRRATSRPPSPAPPRSTRPSSAATSATTRRWSR